MEVSDEQFVYSLSMTSPFTFSEVNWLFEELNKCRDLTTKMFNLWVKSQHIHPSTYLHLLDFNKQ